MKKFLPMFILIATALLINTTNAMSNPASTKCIADGGVSSVKSNTDGSQYGECKFPTGKICEERSYYKGECTSTYATGAILPITTGVIYNTGLIVPKVPMSSLEWAFSKGITKFNKDKDFNGNKSLTREQAAKMFIIFSKDFTDSLYTGTVNDASCKFTDIKKSDTTLQSFIIDSCKKGLFKGNKGNYMPTEKITREQVVIVLQRILGSKYTSIEESINIFFGIQLKNMNTPITRQELIDLMKLVSDTKDNKIVGNDKDPYSCIVSAGYTWSIVKNECIRPFEQSVILLSNDGKEQYGVAFSSDNKQAEIYRGGTDRPSLLTQDATNLSKYTAPGDGVLQKDTNGKWIYTYNDYKFLQK